MKRIIYIVIALAIIIIAVVSLIQSRVSKAPEPEPVVVETPTTETLCFYQSDKGVNNFSDVAWLRATVNAGQVNGELKNLPAEKDSKVGLFSGTISAADANGQRNIEAIWNTMAEGMQNKEQLIVHIFPNRAEVGFAEMVDNGQGVWVYKDPTNIPYFKSISVASCNDLDDRTIVEKYVRDNINTFAPEKAVLGGKWYVSVVTVDPGTHTGTATYEDGHTQGKANFSYTRNNDQVVISQVTKK